MVKETYECLAIHEGSAGKMEIDSIQEMFQRLENLHGVKYINYIGDGDSKTYKGVVTGSPYGETIDIKKKEHINHVQKRMGGGGGFALVRKANQASEAKANLLQN
ncbi:hypothetical protein J437_LFUL016548 [Ladona fulva]|uniref:Mutator-like transposase domain-containing protein n=1 Tax=Ladona fulva TaxID=123851 RepID=A0A8K0P5S5_LADFU|nr:hypothetical protein J437_LFUL016548 [Ladona fulva]